MVFHVVGLQKKWEGERSGFSGRAVNEGNMVFYIVGRLLSIRVASRLSVWSLVMSPDVVIHAGRKGSCVLPPHVTTKPVDDPPISQSAERKTISVKNNKYHKLPKRTNFQRPTLQDT